MALSSSPRTKYLWYTGMLLGFLSFALTLPGYITGEAMSGGFNLGLLFTALASLFCLLSARFLADRESEHHD